MPLRPFFTYYGGKYRSSPHYPAPGYPTIIEPFAGSAGYSLRYPHKRIVLNDVDESIVMVWDYLIHVSADEIRALPLEITHVDDLHVIQEAKMLIGFWLNKGAAVPCKTPSSWMRSGIRPKSYWGQEIRERIASQVDSIRHWTISQVSYEQLPLTEATWFVDPPYMSAAGRHYRRDVVDYGHLGAWSRGLPGQVIVCELEGADWLPFTPFRVTKASPAKRGGKRSREAVWTR